VKEVLLLELAIHWCKHFQVIRSRRKGDVKE